jgi:hypothetical protein
MKIITTRTLLRLVCLAASLALPALRAQAPKPDPDVLIFTNGDKLVGQFVRSAGGSVTFKSDMLGEIHVDWSKIKELHSAQKYAVISKEVKVNKANESTIPQGAVAVADQKIEVSTTPPQSIPVGNAAYVVDEDTFQKAILHNPGFFEAWNGSVTAGASLVEATQDSQTFTGAINLIRAIPTENWLNARNRTTADFSASYGTLSQPGSTTIKTSIYHADAERDQYFSPRAYGFVQAAFDHNFSQGLDLQQMYGGGIGLTLLKNANQTLDLKGSVGYTDQQFEKASVNQTLFGSTFSETYLRKLTHGIVFNEKLTVTPAWNNTNAYSGAASAGITLPAYKRLNVSLNTIDSFLNDTPPGFKKNSFQLTLGLTYALQ